MLLISPSKCTCKGLIIPFLSILHLEWLETSSGISSKYFPAQAPKFLSDINFPCRKIPLTRMLSYLLWTGIFHKRRMSFIRSNTNFPKCYELKQMGIKNWLLRAKVQKIFYGVILQMFRLLDKKDVNLNATKVLNLILTTANNTNHQNNQSAMKSPRFHRLGILRVK